MRERRRFIGHSLFGVALIIAIGCVGGANADLESQLAECNQRVLEEAKKLKECEARLATDGGRPPGGTTIIIQPPGSGGNVTNHFTIGASTAEGTLTGLNLNDRAFGVIKKMKGIVTINGQNFERDIESVAATFGGKRLTIERSDTAPQVFVWKLDGEPMTLVSNQDESAWNEHLCGQLTGPIDVVAKKTGGGTEPAVGVKIELYAQTW